MTSIKGKQPLRKRLTIKDGMTWQEIEKKGNKAQKLASIIFDGDGNGIYDEREAQLFNNTRVSVYKRKNGVTEVKVYNKQTNALITTVNIDKETQDMYDNLHAKQGAYEELTSLSKFFGGSEKQVKDFRNDIKAMQEQLQERTHYNDILNVFS